MSKTGQENSARTDRRKRLAVALKANIKRRKDQLRTRGQRAGKSADEREPTEKDPP